MSVETANQLDFHNAREVQRRNLKDYKSTFFQKYNITEDSAREQSSCPTCGLFTDNVLFTKDDGRYKHCPNCDHIYLSNPLNNEFLIKYYTNYPANTLSWHNTESEFYERIYNKGLSMLNPNNKELSLLDIGCSSGLFLSHASKHGYQGYGIEPNLLERTYALNNGIKVIGSELSDIDTKNKFDVITLWDVLEHIKNPIEYISSFRKYLSGLDACVFIQVPSCDSLAARVLREECKMFDGIEHLTLFSLNSLKIAFSKAGFKLVEAQSVISEKFALSNYLSYCADPYHPTFKSSFPASFSDYQSLEENMLGYKIQATFSLVSN